MGNLNSYIIFTMAYLKEKGESVEDWLHFLGEKFTPTWETFQKPKLKDLAWFIVLNNLSGGAKLVSFSGGDSHVEIILEQWPHDSYAEFSGVSWEECQSIHEVLTPIFRKYGLNYSWSIHDKQVKIELSQPQSS